MESQIFSKDLEDMGLQNTPQYDPYKDEIQKEHTFLPLQQKLESMP